MPFAITIGSDSSAIEAILKRLREFGGDQYELFDQIGAELVESTRQRFIHGEDVDGNPWKRSWRANLQGGQTLRDTGRLMNSYTHNPSSHGVEVGTNVPYAIPLHFGAEILPKNGAYITFAVAGNYRKVKKATLTPRTQLGINAEDERMVLDVVEDFINDYILRST
ncbi:phage virion morphogenesis protein [Acinetobacter sp. ANC 7454]|uniref:phage virion morphogenesis protein n=1 Tax=Acinetobacter thermotolerans TaxID=3151487 RepID=UPI00325C10CF